MFDSFLIRQDSLENVEQEGVVIGFRFGVRIADYRGCILSLHNGYYVEVDGKTYPRSLQKFEINGVPPRTFEELKHCVWEHWDYDDEAMLYIEKPGGLGPTECTGLGCSSQSWLHTATCLLTKSGFGTRRNRAAALVQGKHRPYVITTLC